MLISLRNIWLVAVLLYVDTASSQLISNNAFLKGNYVEVGLAPYGCWGSTVDAPAGYHARSYMNGDGPNFRKLGFVADPGKDGWDAGTPTIYNGDYFLPALPYTGYGVSIGGTDYFAERASNGNGNGMTRMPAGSILSVVNSGGKAEAVWETMVAGIRMRKVVTVPEDNAYFTVRTIFVNTTAVPIADIYYSEYVNPDNDAGYNGTNTIGTVATYNKIVFQNPTDKKALITAKGERTGAYLGLGSLDCRAHVFRSTNGTVNMGGTLTPYASYFGTANMPITGQEATIAQNHFIGISFNIGTINAGDSAAVTFAYVLAEPDLDIALGKTDPVFLYDNKVFNTGDTILSCTNNVLPVVLSNGEDMTWSWSPDTNISTTTGIATDITVGVSPLTYTATGTGLCGSKPVSVVVAPVQPPAVNSPVDYCMNAMALPLISPGLDPLWFTAATGGTGSTLSPTPSTASAGSVSYFVSQSSGNNCYSDRAEIIVNTHAVDNTTDDLSICAAQLPYTWNGITVNAGGNAAASYTTQNRFGCDSTVVLNLTVSPLPPPPVITIVQSASIVCTGTPVTFAATYNNAGAAPVLQWKKNGVTVGSNNETYTDSNLQNGDIISCVLTTNEACVVQPAVESNKVVISVQPAPEIVVTKSNDINCTIGSSRLQASGGTRYEWSPAEGLSDAFISNPVATPAATTTYTVTAFSYGCSNTKEITVEVNDAGAYVVPNAFTPNNDGKNDCFGLRHWGNITSLRLNIYDRWGKLVFTTNNLSDCWNGDFNKEKQPAGVYVYTIKGKGSCGDIDLKGNLLLIR